LSPGFGGMNRSSSAMSFGRGHEATRSTTSFDFNGAAGGVVSSDAAIVEAIQSVLQGVDLDTVTKKQVRALVEQRLQTELVGERRTFVDKQIDRELENM
jgi:chitin synthase